MTTISTRSVPKLDTPTPQPLPGHGGAPAPDPAPVARPTDWRAIGASAGLLGGVAAIGAVVAGKAFHVDPKLAGTIAGIGVGTMVAGGWYGAGGGAVPESPGTITLGELTRPSAAGVATVGGFVAAGAGFCALMERSAPIMTASTEGMLFRGAPIAAGIAGATALGMLGTHVLDGARNH